MKKKKIIAITGDIAAGKSNVVTKIASKLGMNVYSASRNFRELARSYDMNIATFNAYVQQKPEIDKVIDKEMSEFINRNDNLVVDSRLAWHFAKEAFKVFITVDIDIAANRLFKDSVNRNIEDKYATVEDAKVAIIKRQNYERERYNKEYGIDILDYSNYNLVVDSSCLSAETTANKIIEEYNKWLIDRD